MTVLKPVEITAVTRIRPTERMMQMRPHHSPDEFWSNIPETLQQRLLDVIHSLRDPASSGELTLAWDRGKLGFRFHTAG